MESHVGSSQRSSLPGLKRKRTDEVSAPRIGLAQRTKASEPRLGETPTDGTRAQAEPLPDPKIPHGPYRPFTSDPGWSEAWWWLGLPLFVAAFTIGSYWLSPEWYDRVVLPEGYGILEMAHFIIPLFGLCIAGRLLFDPLVRGRRLTFAVALIGAFSCLYIAGEEMSWGQHFFHWNTPEYWAAVNRQQETNLHNTYDVFEKTPRSLLELGIAIGGLGVPLAAIFYPWLRACRASLFLPANALMPLALGAMFFMLVDRLQQGSHIKTLLHRPSETVETYLYLFILAYLIVYARRIMEWKSLPPFGETCTASAERD